MMMTEAAVTREVAVVTREVAIAAEEVAAPVSWGHRVDGEEKRERKEEARYRWN